MLEEESKIECKSPRLQEEFSKLKRTGSPAFLAKRINPSAGIGSLSGKVAPLSTTNLQLNPGGSSGNLLSVGDGRGGPKRGVFQFTRQMTSVAPLNLLNTSPVGLLKKGDHSHNRNA
jgi:hypothetical protein